MQATCNLWGSLLTVDIQRIGTERLLCISTWLCTLKKLWSWYRLLLLSRDHQRRRRVVVAAVRKVIMRSLIVYRKTRLFIFEVYSVVSSDSYEAHLAVTWLWVLVWVEYELTWSPLDCKFWVISLRNLQIWWISINALAKIMGATTWANSRNIYTYKPSRAFVFNRRLSR